MRFGERAWLRALHENAEVAETIGARVFVTSGGRYYLPTPADRPRVMAARTDDDFAARIAYSAAVRNAAVMRAALHRAPTAGDLYIAHVFGAPTAIELIAAVDEARMRRWSSASRRWQGQRSPPKAKTPSRSANSIGAFPARCASRRVSLPSGSI